MLLVVIWFFVLRLYFSLILYSLRKNICEEVHFENNNIDLVYVDSNVHAQDILDVVKWCFYTWRFIGEGVFVFLFFCYFLFILFCMRCSYLNIHLMWLLLIHLFTTMKEVVQLIMFMPLMLFLLDKNVLLVMSWIEKDYMLSWTIALTNIIIINIICNSIMVHSLFTCSLFSIYS